MSVRTSDTGLNALKERLSRHKLSVDEPRHPVNVMHHEEATFGERIADKAAAGIGSWRFLIIQTVAVIAWLLLNIIGLVKHWDPFPFILLNLLFSVQAAYTGPVLLLAGNRQAQKDRLTLEHAAQEADKADVQNVEILKAILKDTEMTERNTELTLQILQHLQGQLAEHLGADAAAGMSSSAAQEPTDRT
ncbi:MAG TPA: DUF1003 domain-containing protein [Candidatus Sulfotelmatobacter sp.]|jgi:uncharacterized membrane protein|nr:DUF1003 domain-containing protein [Candidatus Sulfotelmatobacter sp.]